jgi:hypothetical protein
MKMLAFVLTMMLAVTSAFSQDVPKLQYPCPGPTCGPVHLDPTPKLETWKINDQFSVQYDPTLWKLEQQVENNDKTPNLYPLYKNEKGEMVTRKDALIRVRVIESKEHTFEETVKHALTGLRAEPTVVPLELSEFVAAENNRAVFFAFMQTFEDDPRTYLVNDYAFPGTTGDINSHTTVLFEAMFPAEVVDNAKLMLDRSDAVVKTFTITPVAVVQ